MKLSQISRAGFAACLLLAASLAQADVTRCADAEGDLTYTDTPCQTDEISVPVPRTGTVAATPAKPKASPQRGTFAAAEDVRVAAWAVARTAGPRLPVDAATLKTANASMVLSDRVAAELRRQIVPHRRSWLFASLLN